MSQLSHSSIATIESATGWREHRVQIFDLPEGKVIVKGQRPKRGPWRHRVLRWIGFLLRSPLIKPVPVPGGAESQTIEVQRLTSLAASAVPVPEVLHVADTYFVMRYLGNSDLAATLKSKGLDAFELWRQAFVYLIQAHDAGHYLSQSFARNIVIAQQGGDDFIAGLIDFEDDPAVVMDLLDAQARDWLLLLFSTVYPLNAPSLALQSALTQLLDRESPDVRRTILAHCKKIIWLRHLPNSRKIIGKDGLSLQAAAQAMYEQLKSRGLI